MTAWVPHDSVFALQGPKGLFLSKNTWKLLTLRVLILLIIPMHFKMFFPLKQHQQSFDLICVLVQTSTEKCWILPKISTARLKEGMEKFSSRRISCRKWWGGTGREQTGVIEATENTFWVPHTCCLSNAQGLPVIRTLTLQGVTQIETQILSYTQSISTQPSWI